MNSKGQLLSLDFVLAAVILTMALGIFVYNVDLTQKKIQQYSEFSSNNPEAIAQLLIDGNQNRISSGVTYCYAYSSTSVVAGLTNTCSNFNSACTAGQVFSAQRFVQCPPDVTKACMLSVRTCE